MDLGVAGLASGFDWKALVDQLAEVERLPQKRLRVEQSTLGIRNNAYGSIKTELSVLKSRVEALNDSDLYDTRSATSSATAVGTAKADVGAALGSYEFNITQMATAAVQKGASDVGAPLNSTNDVSGLVLSDANFYEAVKGGTFTVNGQIVSIETSDSLQDVFDAISTATGGTVTGSYDAGTDSISLTSGSEIVLGAGTDTSNFLQLARLHNNGTGSVTSSSSLGSVDLTATASSSHLATALSDGGSGAGVFKVNGVEITFDAGSDSLSDILDRINNSEAGVTASYDSVNDRFLLTNKTTGDVGMALEDVTGNFLNATGLSGGSLTRGNNLLYTVNGGGSLISRSNSITSDSSGIAGLTVTAVTTGTTTVDVAADKEKIKGAITNFIEAYNKAQSLVESKTSSSTSADGKVKASALTGQSDANEIARRLRSLTYTEVPGMADALNHLADLGIKSNGDNNKLEVADEDALDLGLANSMSKVKELFTKASGGIAVQLESYLESTVGDEGSLVTRQDNLTARIADIDTRIADMERVVQANREHMIDRFVTMEQARAKIDQQMQFLLQRFASA